MKFITLLLALLIIGLMLYKQLEGLNHPVSSASDVTTTNSGVPLVPTSPKDLNTFASQVNKLVTDSAAQQQAQIQQQLDESNGNKKQP
ncbi:hypothetical protein PY479_04380 [Shewanella sp. A32]|uniref:hypothetical protein n=1 Tax=Shewanella sp. A32 TaxID=3031327 RepID=UPI0023B9A643|nr:hypothetical protein [Shewanella sp. A32]MDF0533518.1 hypothetical protein [Shewanella sp. A32]